MRKCSEDRWEYHFMKYAINFPNCQYIDINGLILSWQHKNQPIYISSVTSTSRIATLAKQLFCDRNLWDRCFAMFLWIFRRRCSRLLFKPISFALSPFSPSFSFTATAVMVFLLFKIFLIFHMLHENIPPFSNFIWKYLSSFIFCLKYNSNPFEPLCDL